MVNWTVDELIRRQAREVGSSSAHVVTDSLSCEKYRGPDYGTAAEEALRKFRKLRQSARLTRVQGVLRSMQAMSGPPESHAHDLLAMRLRDLVFGSEDTTDDAADQVVHAIEELIVAKLSAKSPVLAKVLTNPPTNPPYKSGSLFSWVSRSPMSEECWVGPVVIGTVSIVRVADDGGGGLYDATFGSQVGSRQEHIPGQHTMAVAKKRVEDRFHEWLSGR